MSALPASRSAPAASVPALALVPAATVAAPAAARVLLVGTIQTVRSAARQLELADPPVEPVGCVLVGGVGDDGAAEAAADPGVPVLGTLSQLGELKAVLGAVVAIVSLPAALGTAIADARAALRRAGIVDRFLPTLGDLTAPLASVQAAAVGGPPPSVIASSAANIDLAGLIGREPHSLDTVSLGRLLSGQRVLITGAGGSIGSEIARICAAYGPSQIVLMERAENALFEIDRQIARRFPGVARKAVLHDVVDPDTTLRHMVDLKPQVVFHAAAHKHVPLMEDHPAHAVSNNLFGTKSIADAALAVGTRRFVMISSDKAVNPTSVMGATKRLAELYVQSLNARASRLFGGVGGSAATPRFTMVRFGNVLGSSCSVLSIWATQLAEGGPITVTDPRMTRYFMTIPEAAALVIQSAAIEPGEPGSTSDVFVLDMGEPVRIVELAQRFVRAHGLEPVIVGGGGGVGGGDGGGPSIQIAVTGIRPGEKLYEELAYASEQLGPTPYAGINAWKGAVPSDEVDAVSMIADLSAVRHSRDSAAVLGAIRRYVPEMRRP